MQKENVVFYEYQRLPKNHQYSTIAIIFFIIICLAVSVWYMDKIPMSTFMFVITPLVVIMLLLAINTFWIYIETVVDKNGIHISTRFLPFYVKLLNIAWEDIYKIEIRQYNRMQSYIISKSMYPVRIKYSNKCGFYFGGKSTVYTMSGSAGVQLLLRNEKKVFIGSSKLDELSETLQKLGKTENINI